MSIDQELQLRSGGCCELCASSEDLAVHVVQPASPDPSATTGAYLCAACRGQIEGGASVVEPNRWRCLGESMWSEHPPVKVLAYRILKRLEDHSWAQDFLSQLYLEDDVRAWAEAKAGLVGVDDVGALKVVDSNGTLLQMGDDVTLIKDLDVKGGGFTAKRGTLVKSITLTDDPTYVEGKVNGMRIVLVAKFLKKA